VNDAMIGKLIWAIFWVSALGILSVLVHVQ
jgi:hypothetical protein